MTTGPVRDEMCLPQGREVHPAVSAHGGHVAHGSPDAIEKTPHLLAIGVQR